MRRSTTYFYIALVAGLAIALLLFAVGCAMPWRPFGVMCGHNGYVSLTLFTFAVWTFFAVASVVIDIRKRLAGTKKEE